jgi:hypothetical protein
LGLDTSLALLFDQQLLLLEQCGGVVEDIPAEVHQACGYRHAEIRTIGVSQVLLDEVASLS